MVYVDKQQKSRAAECALIVEPAQPAKFPTGTTPSSKAPPDAARLTQARASTPIAAVIPPPHGDDLFDAPTPGVTARKAEINTELRRVLSSHTFSKSSRLKHLLQYIVTQWIAGNNQKLDGYNLALDVFQRDASFESGLDPIVRVEMARLRTQLAKYYNSEGAQDTLRIEIPKGGYVPTVTWQLVREVQGVAVSCEQKEARDTKGSTVLVLPLVLQGSAHQIAFYDQMLYLLTHAAGIRVVSRVSANHLASHLDTRLVSQQVGARFIVEGTVLAMEDTYHLIIHLSDTTDGYNIWSGRYSTTTGDLPQTMGALVQDLVAEMQRAWGCGEVLA